MKNFAIIGCGAAARIHAGALKEMPNGRLYGVYDKHADRAQAFAAENQCKAFTSLDEVLSCEEVDIVNICLPSGLHGTTAASPGYPRRIEINGTKGSVVLEEDSIVRWDVEG